MQDLNIRSKMIYSLLELAKAVMKVIRPQQEAETKIIEKEDFMDKDILYIILIIISAAIAFVIARTCQKQNSEFEQISLQEI